MFKCNEVRVIVSVWLRISMKSGVRFCVMFKGIENIIEVRVIVSVSCLKVLRISMKSEILLVCDVY